jgi:spore cortex formation protein SpoVR/YcgB (stage V sporulation)
LEGELIRDLKLFTVSDDERIPDLIISAIHDESGYQKIRQSLSDQYNLSNIEPNIQVYNVNVRGDRALLLRHVQHKNRPLSGDTETIMKYLHQLWGFTVRLESVDDKGHVQKIYQYPL